MKKKIVFLLILHLGLFLYSTAQKYISDTVIVLYNPQNEINVSFCFDSIMDMREDGSLITITEKKRYLFMPVDRYYMLPSSLSSTLKNSVVEPPQNQCKKTISANIEHFSVSERKSSFFPAHILHAKINIAELQNDSLVALGSLIYDTEVRKNEVKGKPEKILEELIKRWNKELVNNLNTISYTESNVYSTILPNLRTVGFDYKKQLHSAAVITVGKNWFTLEGEMHFAYPETGQAYFRAPKTVKYRHMEKFESLEFGSINDHFCYQINPSLKFVFATKIFIGINRWNDIETVKHKLEEMMLLDFSLNQNILFYSPNKRGIYGGIGLTEDLLYIIKNPLMFKPGINLQIGLKL